jgi:hypothetical protein
MFFIKWLTIADNQFTDNDIGNATIEEKKRFETELAQQLSTFSSAEQYALSAYLFNKLDTIEKKLDNHSQESRTTLRQIHYDIITIKETCINLATQNPEEAKKFIEAQSKQLGSLLLEVEKALHSADNGNSVKAKKWKERLVNGIGITADIIALLTFISGIPSIPALIYSPQATQAITILKQFSESLKL